MFLKNFILFLIIYHLFVLLPGTFFNRTSLPHPKKITMHNTLAFSSKPISLSLFNIDHSQSIHTILDSKTCICFLHGTSFAKTTWITTRTICTSVDTSSISISIHFGQQFTSLINPKNRRCKDCNGY